LSVTSKGLQEEIVSKIGLDELVTSTTLPSKKSHDRNACAGQERQCMTETNRTQTLVATLRHALAEMEAALGLTREGVDAISQETVRLREGLAALGAWRRQETPSVGIDIVIDAVALLQAFHDLDLALPDAQVDLATLEGELEDEDTSDV
jgi:hypothetical protein